MTKFHMSWELKPEAIPEDPEDAAKLWVTQIEMVKEQFKAGITTDWGLFAGELRGYSVSSDTTEEELHAILLRWSPFVKFKVKAVLTPDQAIAAVKKSQE